MKRKIALALVGVMMCAALGCGNKPSESSESDKNASESDKNISESADESSEETVDLTFAWWGNQTRNEMTQQVIDLYTEQNTNIEIDGQFSEWADYWNKLATASAGHTLPDLVQMDYQYIEQYSNNGLLVDLTPYIEDGTIDVSNIDENNLNISKVGDGIYGICLTVSPTALMYNKTLLDENDIQIKDNMNMEEFYDVCREVYEKTGYKTNIAYGSTVYLPCYLRANDEVLYEKGKLGVESPDSLKPFFEIYEKGLSEGWHLEASAFAERTIGTIEQDPLVYGSSPDNMSWCAFQWGNQLTAMQNAAPEGMEIALTTYPSPDPVKSNFMKPSQIFCITTDSKNPDESAKFIDFLVNSVECNEIILCERGIQTNTAVGEDISHKLNETDQKAVKYTNEVVVPNSSAADPAPPEGSSEVGSLFIKVLEEVCYGKIDAAQAAQELFDQGNEIMSSKQ